MRPLAPSVRAAAVALIALTVAAVSGVGLHLSGASAAAEREARAGAVGAARAAAATLAVAPRADPAAVLTAAAGAPPESGAPPARVLALVDAAGRLVAASAGAGAEGVRWDVALAASRPPTVTLGGHPYFLSVVAAPGGGRVAALASEAAARARYRPAAWGAAGLGAALWALVAAAIAAGAWYAGPRAGARLGAVAARLAAPDGPQGDDRRRFAAVAAREFGPLAAPLDAIGEAVDRSREQLAEARATLAALLQINPHYVLLCTLDGHIVDANPAFYAVTGLPFEAVRGNRVEVLSGVLPVEPLFELARRSFREGSSISGVEYALMNRDEQRRPVQVSLRAVTVGGKPAVVIQATDVANQRTLENQIAQFSDALDLMVDQRVAQLAAGNAGLEGLLDAANVVVAAFDGGGGTRRLSRAAEALVGAPLAQVPHLTAFVDRLGLSAPMRDGFLRWALGDGPALVQTPVGSAAAPRVVLWRRGAAAVAGEDAGGTADRRVLVGLELPQAPVAAGGDGAATAAALR